MAAREQADVATAPREAQQEPDLLLALVGAAPLALHPMQRHVVVQPVARAPENLDVLGLEPRLFLQLPVHRLLGSLPRLDAALGELPSVLLDALAPKHLVPAVAD